MDGTTTTTTASVPSQNQDLRRSGFNSVSDYFKYLTSPATAQEHSGIQWRCNSTALSYLTVTACPAHSREDALFRERGERISSDVLWDCEDCINWDVTVTRTCWACETQLELQSVWYHEYRCQTCRKPVGPEDVVEVGARRVTCSGGIWKEDGVKDIGAGSSEGDESELEEWMRINGTAG